MKFEKDGVTYEVKDQAHIDCFRAKGWAEVKNAEPVKKRSSGKTTK